MAVSIIPRPSTVVETGAALVLDETTAIACPPGLRPVARVLQRRLRESTGWELPLADPADAGPGAISIGLDPGLGASAYAIDVDETGAALRGGDAAGAFHATQVLLQLLPPAVFRRVPLPGVDWTVPGVRIEDRPRFGWRGMLIDVSRHFFGRDAILTLIDALALHRMNVLHLHLTDDQGWRIEIERYPRLTEVGSRRGRSVVDNRYIRAEGAAPVHDHAPHDGCFTRDDLREIVAYAAERFITVVPEIDIPGHSQAAIAAYPELGNAAEPLEVWTDWGISSHVLNVEEPTLRFYEHVLDEVLEIFPSPFIHIGGDEVPKDEWRASPSVQARMRELGVADEEAMQSAITARFERYLAARGRRLVGWDEILEGGLPPGATVMSWRGMEGGVAAAEAGHDVIMTPDPDVYLYHPQSHDRASEPLAADVVVDLRRVFDFDPMPPRLAPAAREHVLGAQCQMWTEFVSSERQMHQLVFPRLCAFAEAVWREGGADDEAFADFERRLVVHRERLHALDIDGYRPLTPSR